VRAAIQAQVWPNDSLIGQTYLWVPCRALEALFPLVAFEDRKVRRYSIMRYLVGKESSKDLTDSECNALVAWAHTEAAQAEAAAILDAIGEERKRQALEGQENQRRLVQEQRRQRATQLAAMAGSGAMLGTGSSLALEADTWAKQQTELADQQYVNQLSQRQLAYQRTSTLQMGQQTAAGIRSDATGQAIGNIGSTLGQAYQSWSTRPQAAGGATSVAKPGSTSGSGK
jgi:hypothetical protein